MTEIFSFLIFTTGLMKDDTIPEEHPLVLEAMKRLSDKELYERAFRQQRATELSFRQELLPKELHITKETVY